MLFEPRQIAAMRNALLTAEQAMLIMHPGGFDDATREALAKSIVASFSEGHTNPLVASSKAVRSLTVQSAA